MAQHNLLGKEGEEQARAYLQAQGYAILHTNWRYRRNELDIVAATEQELVVVEVKTRSENCLEAPQEAVDMPKIKRTVAAADVYVRKFDVQLPVRFDIVTVIKTGAGYRIEHIDNAFYSPLW